MYHSSLLAFLFGTTLVSAAAISAPLKPRILSADDVIVWGKNGRVEVMNKSSYALLANYSGRPADIVTPTPISANSSSAPAKTLSSRCAKDTIVTLYNTSYFMNWDVPMSGVVSAKDGKATVAVTAGYSIANTVTVGGSMDFTIIKDFLGLTYKVDYSQSWTSQNSVSYSFEVPKGKYGAVVSNPTTTRHTGHVIVGCIGEEGEKSVYQADSYSSKSYGGLAWVDGVISLCTGDNFPLMRCVGEGML